MRRDRRLAAFALAVALVVTGCWAAEDGETEPTQGDALRVFGNYQGATAEAFRQVLDDFTDATGIEARFTGTAGFAGRVQERIRDGDPPDVALFPQPAIVAELARAGTIVSLDEEAAASVTVNYSPDALDVMSVDGELYGVWFRVELQSLVWYPPAVFEELGYSVPATWPELLELSDRMTADGYTPWCIGMEAFGSTGWLGTDWVEDMVLRLHGPEVYDQWTGGTIAFTDDRIREAFGAFGEIAFQPGWVAGGNRAILTVPVMRAIDPMIEDPPGCLMTRQGSGQLASLPDNVTAGPGGDLDVFVLPGMAESEAPLLAAGEIAVAFTASAEAQALLEFLANPEAGESWAAAGGYISPHAEFDSSAYSVEFDRRIAGLLSEASAIRFDGSDLMAPEVGTGTFWTGMVDYVAGTGLDRVLADIQAGYDR